MTDCKFYITGTRTCPNEAMWEARKHGERYSVYCGTHADVLRPLHTSYGLRVILRQLTDDPAGE